MRVTTGLGRALTFAGVCAAVLTAVSPGVAPVRAQEAASLGTGYSRMMTNACLNVWSLDREGLGEYAKNAESMFNGIMRDYRKSHDELVDAIRDGEVALSVADERWKNAAMVAAANQAPSDGTVMSDADAARVDTSALAGFRAERDRLVDQLQGLRRQLLGVDRRIAGWRAVSVGISECVNDQRAWLDRGGKAGTEAPAAPRAPAAPEPGDISTIFAEVGGLWKGKCEYGGVTIPWDRAFDLKIDRGKITATFIEGAQATVTGEITSGGRVQGDGRFPLEHQQVDFTMEGNVRVQEDGGIHGTGSFEASGSSGISCKGVWIAG